jgi:hypothetical protein
VVPPQAPLARRLGLFFALRKTAGRVGKVAADVRDVNRFFSFFSLNTNGYTKVFILWLNQK